jgi:hypothetical protein
VVFAPLFQFRADVESNDETTRRDTEEEDSGVALQRGEVQRQNKRQLADLVTLVEANLDQSGLMEVLLKVASVAEKVVLLDCHLDVVLTIVWLDGGAVEVLSHSLHSVLGVVEANLGSPVLDVVHSRHRELGQDSLIQPRCFHQTQPVGITVRQK